MPKLTAKFLLRTEAPILASWTEDSEPFFAIAKDDFHIDVRFLLDRSHCSGTTGSNLYTYAIKAMELSVSRNEEDLAPKPTLGADGSRDMTSQQAFLRGKLDSYAAAAKSVAYRMLNFFKFELSTPLVRDFNRASESFINPCWFDFENNELTGPITFVAEAPAGWFGQLNAKKFTADAISPMIEYSSHPAGEPSLILALLSDAQAAWFEGNLRRAILELAICIEVMVKRKFFAAASPAGAAFDYLEDKGRVTATVLEFLGTIAQEAFGFSYKDMHRTHYDNIEYIFRCRNKIAHRGELEFRNIFGVLTEADRPMVELWWLSALHLKEWIDEV